MLAAAHAASPGGCSRNESTRVVSSCARLWPSRSSAPLSVVSVLNYMATAAAALFNWADYHLLLGLEHMVFVDNNCGAAAAAARGGGAETVRGRRRRHAGDGVPLPRVQRQLWRAAAALPCAREGGGGAAAARSPPLQHARACYRRRRVRGAAKPARDAGDGGDVAADRAGVRREPAVAQLRRRRLRVPAADGGGEQLHAPRAAVAGGVLRPAPPLCGGSDPRRRRHRARRAGLPQREDRLLLVADAAVRHVRVRRQRHSNKTEVRPLGHECQASCLGGTHFTNCANLRHARLPTATKLFSDAPARRFLHANGRLPPTMVADEMCHSFSGASGDPIASGLASGGVWINHYQFQSLEHWEAKKARGRTNMNRKRKGSPPPYFNAVEDAAGALALRSASARWPRRRCATAWRANSRCCPARPPPRRRDSRGRRPLPTRSSTTGGRGGGLRWGGSAASTSTSSLAGCAACSSSTLAAPPARASLIGSRGRSAAPQAPERIDQWELGARRAHPRAPAHCQQRRGGRRDAAPQLRVRRGRDPTAGRQQRLRPRDSRARASVVRDRGDLARAAPARRAPSVPAVQAAREAVRPRPRRVPAAVLRRERASHRPVRRRRRPARRVRVEPHRPESDEIRRERGGPRLARGHRRVPRRNLPQRAVHARAARPRGRPAAAGQRERGRPRRREGGARQPRRRDADVGDRDGAVCARAPRACAGPRLPHHAVAFDGVRRRGPSRADRRARTAQPPRCAAVRPRHPHAPRTRGPGGAAAESAAAAAFAIARRTTRRRAARRRSSCARPPTLPTRCTRSARWCRAPSRAAAGSAR